MQFNELKLNADLMYFGRKYTVITIDPPTVSLRRSEGDGETIRINFYELVTNPSFRPGKIMLKSIEEQDNKYRSILDAIDGNKREQVSFRFNLIKPILVLERVKQHDLKAIYEFYEFYKEYLSESQAPEDLTQEELIEKIKDKYSKEDEDGITPRGVSVRTIKRHLAKFRLAEAEMATRGEEALVSRAGEGHLYRTDNKLLEICHPKKPDWVLDTFTIRLDEKYIPILKNTIEKQYLNVKKPSKQAVFDSIELQCIKLGIEPPKWITIMKLLGRIKESVEIRLREGDRAAAKFDSVERGYSNNEAMYPLHIVQIDHTQLDMDVLDEAGYELGRPWITLGIDVFSRCVWCLYISFEPPSANVVRKAIQHGIFFKRSKERFGTMNEWEVFGIPSIIYLDNGSDFRSVQVKRLIKETLKSHVRYRPVGTPRFGATIERLFGTINKEFIHRLDGTRKSNPVELGEYDPSEDTKLTLQDISTLLARYITDIYHMEPHRGLPLDSDTPIVRYYEGLQKVGFPEFIDEAQEPYYEIEFLPTAMKPYTNDGVRLDNVLYKNTSLNHLIDGRSKKYQIKYDDDDISRIYLMPPGSDEYIQVPAVHPSAEELVGVNRFQWKQLRKNMSQESDRKRSMIPGTQQVAQAKVKLAEEISVRYSKGRKLRQQAARMGMSVSVAPVQPPTTTAKISHTPTIKDKLEAAKRAALQRLEKERDAK